MRTFLLFSIFMICFTSNAQQVELKKNFWGYKATINGQKASMSELDAHLSRKLQALETFRKGKTKRTLATVMSFAGGVCLGITAAKIYHGSTSSDDQISVVTPAVGVALIGGGIALSISGNKNIKNSINQFNKATSMTEVKLISNQNGVGFALSL